MIKILANQIRALNADWVRDSHDQQSVNNVGVLWFFIEFTVLHVDSDRIHQLRGKTG